MEVKINEIKRSQSVNVLIAILMLGSIWGLSEVVLSGALRAAELPFRAGILTGIGIGIMGVAIGIFRKSSILIGIALVAIFCKQLVVPILHVSVMCKVNSCLAVMLEGVALTGVISLAGRKLEKGYLPRIAVGASGALLAATAFYFVGMHVAPCQSLLAFKHAGGLVAFLTVEGLVWAVFSAIFFPLGYWLGARFRNTVLTLQTRKPLLYYTTSSTLVICCWAASAFAIGVGL